MSDHNDQHDNDEAHDKPSAKSKKDERPQPMIEPLLKDPAFDPKGAVRTKLAELLMTGTTHAPADLVDADGNVVEQPAE